MTTRGPANIDGRKKFDPIPNRLVRMAREVRNLSGGKPFMIFLLFRR